MNTGLTLERICQAFVGAWVNHRVGNQAQDRIGRVVGVTDDREHLLVSWQDDSRQPEQASAEYLQVVEPVEAWYDPSTKGLVVVNRDRRIGQKAYLLISQELLDEARR